MYTLFISLRDDLSPQRISAQHTDRTGHTTSIVKGQPFDMWTAGDCLDELLGHIGVHRQALVDMAITDANERTGRLLAEAGRPALGAFRSPPQEPSRDDLGNGQSPK